MYHHVMVPIDCSDDARNEAYSIASHLATMEGTLVTIAAGITPSFDSTFRAKKVEHARVALRAIGDILDERGIRSRHLIVEGADVAQALADEAYSIDQQYDLFLLGVHQTRPEFDDAPGLGSFADQLARCTHLPVMILPAQA
jgi:nucleotide-binding universal stress UspA family protein